MKKIKVKRLKNVMLWTEEKQYIESPTGDSLTVQDDTLSVAEMLNRLAAGMPVTNRREPVYLHDDDEEAHEDFDLEKVGKMDSVDHQELMNEAGEILENFEQKKKAYKARKEAEKKAGTVTPKKDEKPLEKTGVTEEEGE